VFTTDPVDLLRYEYLQRRESGYDVTSLSPLIEGLISERVVSRDAFASAYEELLAAPRLRDWPYVEPDRLDEIISTLPGTEPFGAPTNLSDKIHGAWLGRCVGCNLGKPVELGEYWTRERIRSYLQCAGAWPLSDYIPALDPMPPGYELRECWTETTLGNIRGSARDDDIDYSLLALHLIEQHGTDLRPDHVASAWTSRLPYMLTYTAERATYRNLVNGCDPLLAAEHQNPYREWIGAQIRGDVFGYVNPGDPRRAATEAYQDAALSHRANGIYGEMWSAALVAAAFTSPDPESAVRCSLDHIPPQSRLYETVSAVVRIHASGQSWEEGRRHIDEVYGHYNWVHTVNNAAIVTAGLLWGGGDFTRTIALTVVGGWDTDSNGATAGSVVGAMVGASGIPPHWTQPLQDTVRSALAGFDKTTITSLAQRTLSVVKSRASERTARGSLASAPHE